MLFVLGSAFARLRKASARWGLGPDYAGSVGDQTCFAISLGGVVNEWGPVAAARIR